MRVRNMVSPRSGREVANQFVIEHEGKTYFQSYSTIIAVREGGKLTFDKSYWDCSVTTSKYRNEFTRMNTADTKKAIKNGEIELANLNS